MADWVEKYHQQKQAEQDQKGGPGSGHWGHEGRPGQVGGSAPWRMAGRGRVNREYFTKGPGRNLVQDLAPKYRKQVVDVLTDISVQPRHLAGLEGITMKPYLGFGETWPANMGGVYDPMSKTIHLKPSGFDRRTVISHELGHHVTMESMWTYHQGQEGDKSLAAMDDAYIRMKKHRVDMGSESFKTKLRSMGLRTYSVKDTWEWRADSWNVYQFGTDRQKQALAEYHGYDSLNEIFGS